MKGKEGKAIVEKLVSKFEAGKSYYQSERYNETLLRSEFLDPLFESLGWDINNSAGLSISEREVLLEESLKDGSTEHTKKPDYTFRLFAERKFFLEAKKPAVNILTDPSPAKQVRRYGFTAGLKVSVLSNFEYLAIYDMSVPVDPEDTAQKARVKLFHYTEYTTHFKELLALLGHGSVYDGTFDKKWEDINGKTSQSIPFDSFFLKQINSWRIMLGREILGVLPDIGMDPLNDTVQSYINKILFLRVCEDRNIEDYETLLLLAKSGNFSQLIEKFSSADKKYNSGLFESTAADKLLSPGCDSFWTIIRQLYYPECPYSFSVLSSDILGRIYELFLSKKLAVVDGKLDLVDKPENVDKDVVTTPTYIIRDLLSKTVVKLCRKKSIQEIRHLSFADIACGSGAFLLELYWLLCDMAVEYCVKHDKSALIKTSVGTYRLRFEYKRDILTSCIFGVDKDYNAVEATKFGLLLKLLEDEDVNSVSDIHPILPKLDGNIFWGNSLIDGDIVDENEREIINPFDFNGRHFDVIMGNPPYMKTEDMKNFSPSEFPIYKSRYRTAYKQFDKYFLFIERGLGLLKDDGMLCFIVPSKFMKVGSGMKLRQLISSNNSLCDLTSFGANLIFSDKSTYTCLLVLSRRAQRLFNYTEVNNIDGWIARDRNAYFTGEKKADTINSNVWVLYPDSLDNVYHSIMDKSTTLSSIVGDDNIFNGVQTSAADIYVVEPLRIDANYIYFRQKEKDYKIERKFIRPFFKTAHGHASLNTYQSFKPNSALVYPYEQLKDGTIDLVPLPELRNEAPCLLTYLMDNKGVLSAASRDIKPKPKSNDEWYRYGRHQSLGMGKVKIKIIVGILSKGGKYGIDTQGVFLASGGTAGYCAIGIPDKCKYSPYYIQAILNSKYVEWIASLRGEIFRGGFIARGTKVLQDMPIRKINFDDVEEKELHDRISKQQMKLISLGDACMEVKDDKRRSVIAERNFSHELEVQNENLRELYGLSRKVDELVPLIEKIYAAD